MKMAVFSLTSSVEVNATEFSELCLHGDTHSLSECLSAARALPIQDCGSAEFAMRAAYGCFQAHCGRSCSHVAMAFQADIDFFNSRLRCELGVACSQIQNPSRAPTKKPCTIPGGTPIVPLSCPVEGGDSAAYGDCMNDALSANFNDCEDYDVLFGTSYVCVEVHCGVQCEEVTSEYEPGIDVLNNVEGCSLPPACTQILAPPSTSPAIPIETTERGEAIILMSTLIPVVIGMILLLLVVSR